MPSLPTGTVTFLFTDIEGSTVLLQRLGDRRYAEVLAEHRRLLREAFAKGNGQGLIVRNDGWMLGDATGKRSAALYGLERKYNELTGDRR
jgi:class 3 adenylate cyclase